jgi:uncharacterized membrane protein YfcA
VILDAPTVAWLFVVVGGASVVQTAAGFGFTLLCVTFGAFVLPVEDLLTVVLPLSFSQSAWVSWRNRAHVNKPLLGYNILPLMGVGLVVGRIVGGYLSGLWVLKGFALWVLVLSAREAWIARQRSRGAPESPPSVGLARGTLVLAGVAHGLWATGGPLVVSAVQSWRLSKSEFRSTLSSIWAVLDGILVCWWGLSGRFTATSQGLSLGLVAAVVVGMVVGERLHHQVEEKSFRAGTFALLAVAALALLVK